MYVFMNLPRDDVWSTPSPLSYRPTPSNPIQSNPHPTPLFCPCLPRGWAGCQYEFYTIRVSRGQVENGLASPHEPEVS